MGQDPETVEESLLEAQLKDSSSTIGVCRKLSNLDYLCVDYHFYEQVHALQEGFEITHYLNVEPDFFTNYLPRILARVRRDDLFHALDVSAKKNIKRVLDEVPRILNEENLWVDLEAVHLQVLMELLSYGIEFGDLTAKQLEPLREQEWVEDVLNNSSLFVVSQNRFFDKRLEALKEFGTPVIFGA